MNDQSQTNHRQSNNESELASLGEKFAGKYMTFRLAHEDYAIAILNVVQLIRLQNITRVPRMPDFVRGVINLRGKVIPTIDLRLKFGMGRVKETDHTVIIVVQHETDEGLLTMGLLVDEVLEVVNLVPTDITPTPNFGGGVVDTDFILSLGTIGDRVLFLLDIELVLSADERRQIEGKGKAGSVSANVDTLVPQM